MGAVGYLAFFCRWRYPLQGMPIRPPPSRARRICVIMERSSAGFTGLAMHRHVELACSGAHLVGAVGGDQHRRHVIAGTVARSLRIESRPVLAVEVVVDQDDVGA